MKHKQGAPRKRAGTKKRSGNATSTGKKSPHSFAKFIDAKKSAKSAKNKGGKRKFDSENKNSDNEERSYDRKPKREGDSKRSFSGYKKSRPEGDKYHRDEEKKFVRKSDKGGPFKPSFSKDSESRFKSANSDKNKGGKRKFDSENKNSDKEGRSYDRKPKRESDSKQSFSGYKKSRPEGDKYRRDEEKKFVRKSDKDGPFKPSFSKDSESHFKGDAFRKKDHTGFDKSTERTDKRRESFNKAGKKSSGFKKSRGDSSHFNEHIQSDGPVRLNKYLANAGIASRRDADNLILGGTVKVNGAVVDQLGYKVMPGDKVTYGDSAVKTERKVYVLLNKPKDFITTTSDPQERRTVMELVRPACRERIYPVGRLDRNTTGLLLFTNDGEIATKLTHPKNLVKKLYHVVLDKNIRSEDFDQLIAGVELEDGFIKPDQIAFVGGNRKELGVEIHSGKNRVIRRIFEHLDYQVIKLDRVVFAGLTKKDLPRGKYRFLTEKEVAFLKMLK